jgi:hypothetical protein
MKYRIKNPEVEKAVRGLFKMQEDFERELNEACELDTVCVIKADGCYTTTGGWIELSISMDDIEEVHEYSHQKWNPYPQVTPPKDDYYRVQMTLPNFEVRRFMLEWRDGKWRVDYLPEHQELLFKPWDDEEDK